MPDTNVFLEYEHFTQIDWASLLRAHRVTLLVTFEVLGEIDKHKAVGDRRRDRAIGIANRLEELLEGDPKKRARLRADVDVVMSSILVDPDVLTPPLSKYRPDDLVLATVVQLNLRAPGSAVYVTGDTNALLRGRLLGVPVFKMPDRYRLATPPVESRELRDVRSRLASTEARLADVEAKLIGQQPALSLIILGPDGRTMDPTFTIRVPRRPTENDFVNQLVALKARLGLPVESKPAAPGIPTLQTAVVDTVLRALEPEGVRQATASYLKQVEAYLEVYRRYLENHVVNETILFSTFELRFRITNRGRVPARECQLVLHFPGGFTVSDEPLPPLPKPPRAPRRQSIFPTPAELRLPALLHGPEIAHLIRRVRSVLPMIREMSEGIEVIFRLADIPHGASLGIRTESIWVMLPHENAPSVPKIEYQIHAANLPEPTVGTFEVKANVIEVEPWTTLEFGETREEDESNK